MSDPIYGFGAVDIRPEYGFRALGFRGVLGWSVKAHKMKKSARIEGLDQLPFHCGEVGRGPRILSPSCHPANAARTQA